MKLVSYLGKVTSYISCVVVALIMLLTVADVFMRYVFMRPIFGATDSVELMMSILILSIVPPAIKNKHIRLDILVDRLPPKGQAFFDSLTVLIGLIFITVIGWRSLSSSFFMMVNNVKSPMLGIPLFPFYLVMGFAFLTLSVCMISIFVKRLLEYLRTR